MPRSVFLACTVSCLAMLPSAGSQAANEAFQNFFFGVCGGATGALADRCAETPLGAGDLSGNSETSLNPSQTLSNTDAALSSARARSKESRERIARYGKEEGEAPSGGEIRLGPFSLLVNARREWEERDRDLEADAERGYDADRLAFEIGIDRRFSDRFVAGLLYTYEDGELDFDGEAPGVNFTPVATAGSIERDAHALTVFGVWQLSDQGYLEASAGYTRSDYSLERRAVFQETTRTVAQTNVHTTASTDGEQFWVGLTAGYDWNLGATNLGVYGGAIYADSKVDGYTERDPDGTGLALVVDDVDRDVLTAHLGVRAQYAISTASAVWLPHVRVEYEYMLDDDEARASVQFAQDASGNQFALAGREQDDFFSIGLGIAGMFPDGWMTFLDVEGLAGARDRDMYRVTVGLRKEL